MALAWLLPWPLVRVAGAGIGLAFYLVDRVHRKVTLENLTAAMPHRSEAERRTIARSVFMHFGRVLLELLKFGSLDPRAMIRATEVEGGEHAQHAYAQGRGVIFFTGHFGFWEVIGLSQALRLEPIDVLARPLDNPYLNDLLEKTRCATGNGVIYRRGAIRRVLRVLEGGHGIGVLIDQHVHGPDSVTVDFFGRPAGTTNAIAAVALRTGSPVVPVFALPAEGGGYRIIYEHAVEPPQSDAPDPVREFTQRCTDVLEMYVRRHPELWLWMHRRWRTAGTMTDPGPGMFPRAQPDAEADA
jgi:KDO2-lipid IV(A) lauroyltransferase